MMTLKQSLIANHKTMRKVCSNIRLLSILLCTFCLANTLAYSQQSTQTGQSEPLTVENADQQNQVVPEPKTGQSDKQAVDKSAQAEAESQMQTKSLNQSDDGVIRLEDTIRGNKEQPQVLTIVPWQLPVHQRINENTEWQLQVNQLTSIERSAFLRNLAVVNELKRAQKSGINLNENNKGKD